MRRCIQQPSETAFHARRLVIRQRLFEVVITHAGEDSMPTPTPPTSVHSIGADEKEFLFHLGWAITEWANIDERLFNICAIVLNVSKRLSAILYYRNNTLGSRLSFTDEIVRTVLPERDRKNGGHDHHTTKMWRNIFNLIDERLKFRNQLAHSPSGPRTEIEDKADGSWHITDIWWASYQSVSEQERGKNPLKEIN